MARPLTGAARGPGRRPLLTALLLALLLHALALALLQRVLQPPSLLRVMAPPFYTRTLAPEAPAPITRPAPVKATVSKPNRPSALIRRAPAATKNRATSVPADAGVAAAPEPPASAALAEAPPGIASEEAPSAPALAAEPAAQAEPLPAPGAPAPAASAAEIAFLAQWPSDTRLTYKLGGNYRGELHGDARVLWQRIGTRYQAVIAISAGLLGSLTLSSQGEITSAGLRPEVYEEDLRGRRRGVRLQNDDVLLHNGQRVPRPDAAQDTASQFAEIGHRLAMGEIIPAPGVQIFFPLARPGGVDDWSYDVIGEETVHLPRHGAIAAWHVKPRRIDKPRGPFMIEMWLAPTLQYLPVRIRITQDEDTYLDLLAQTIEQQ